MFNKILRRSVLFSIFLLYTAAANAALTLGPYLQNGTEQSMTIHWRSSASGIGRITYGTSQSNLSQSVDESTSGTNHIVTVTGLQPGTKYYYRVGNGASQETPTNASEQYFITNPSGAVKTRIWALGDAGTGTTNQDNVRNAYYTYTGNVRTDVVLALGDNAYNNGSDSEFISNFFNVYQDMFVNTPIWSTQGNHERNQSVYEDVFTHPTAGEGGGVASGSELYYSFNYGDIHFVCLDSYSSAINIDPGAPQYQWLEQDLQANSKKWVIAFWHHPPYSKTSGHNSDSESGMRKLRENANVLLEQYGVDLVLGGHNHSYNRSYFINGHYGVESTFNPATHKVQDGDGSTTPYNKTDEKGAIYVMSGSAGKTGYSLDTHDANVAKFFNLGSFVIDIDGNNLTGRYLRETGAIDDVFSIDKTPAANTAPVAIAGPDASVQIPAAVSLNGSVSDDAYPGTTLTQTWSQVSGPGTTTFANSSAASTTATFNSAGTYVLRLTANDGEFTHSDDTSISVAAAPQNQAPVANAGNNLSIELPATANLLGSCSDDGLPVGATVSASWSGDAGVTFANSNSANTTASFSSAGTYNVSLNCNDTLLSGNASAVITVTAEQPNIAPTVDAGADFSSIAGTSSTLAGTASDDGRPFGGSLTTTWSKTSGPGSVTFTDASSLTSGVTFSAEGNYTLNLSASDTAASSNDTVNVTVSAVPVELDNESFETNLGSWSNTTTGDNYDWTRDSGGTASSGTGPSTGAASSTWYMYLETSNNSGAYSAGDTAILESASLDGTNRSFSFDYHMYGSNMGTLDVEVSVNGGSWTNVWTISGQQHTSNAAAYSNANIDLSTYNGSLKVRFKATAVGGYRGDMAIDNPILSGIDTPAQNQAPTTNAGSDQTINLPNSATLAGNCSDDGLPNGSTLSCVWSGPSGVTFTDATNANSSASFSATGSYTLTLTANDGELSSSDTLIVTVNPAAANQAPTASAGIDQSIGLTDTATLAGSCSDDGLPTGASVTASWTGDTGVSFANASTASTTATFNGAGNYTVTLTCNDSELSGSDTAVIGVTEATNVLSNGVPITGISGASKEQMFYTMNVPAGSTDLVFTTVAGSGDADLYIKFGSQPSLTDYECRGNSSTGNETCNITNIQAGTYHVMVEAWNAINGVSLTGSYTTPTPAAPVFNSDPFAKSSAAQGQAYSDSIANDASDANGDAMSFSKVSGPSWLSVASNGSLSGTPTSADVGSNSFVVRVSDGSLTSDGTMTINVTDGSTPVTLSSSDFEADLNDWSNPTTGDNYDWTRDSSGTPSSSTGPTSGANGSSYYLFLETSDGGRGAFNVGETAYLESIDFNGANRSLTFDYHMYGSEIGTLSVDVFTNGSWQNDVWQLSGQQQSSQSGAYQSASVDLSSFSGTIKIRMRATAAGGWHGDMAIDNLVLTGTN